MMVGMRTLKSLMERGLFVSGIEQAMAEESTEIPLELIEEYKIYKQADIKFRAVIDKYFGG